MSRTAAECAGQILSTISTSLIEMAATAQARLSVLEEENALLRAELTTLKTQGPEGPPV